MPFRLPPQYLGAPLRWFRMLSNLTSDQVAGKETIPSKVTTGCWQISLPHKLLDLCYEVVRYNAQSKNEEDMYQQKELWIKMHEATRGYDVSGFRTKALRHESFQHDKDEAGRGVTHKCMTYLQRASDPVDVRKGEWRLWEAPQAVERAKVLYERTKNSDEVILTPGPQLGSGGSRASNVATSSTCGLKRTKVSPASPESIAKSARTLWNTNRDRMRAQWLEYFPKLFQYYLGKLHFCIDNCTAGLRFYPEPYAPTLKYFTSGYLQYVDVIPYDIKWLK